MIKLLSDRQSWKNFILAQPYTLFTQAWQYGEFYRALGEDFWVFGVYNDRGELRGGSLVVSTHAKRGKFLYLPYGPIVTDSDSFAKLIIKIKNFARERGYDFIRCSPFVDDTEHKRREFQRLGFRAAPMHILAETTWLLDLAGKDEANLFAQMNKNHRHLIRRCEREGVRVEFASELAEVAKFYTMHQQTAKRHHFVPFRSDYIMEEFKSFTPEHITLLKGMLPDGVVDSYAIIVYYGNMACYRHGASLGLNPHAPTSYLVQWEAIREAKRRSLKWYNFWGIAPTNVGSNHPFYGLSHFKRGFGGFQKDLLHCQDLPLRSTYWWNWTVETLRRVRRGF